MPDSQDSLSGLGLRSSLYIKGTTPGDTAWQGVAPASDPGAVTMPGVAMLIGSGGNFVRVLSSSQMPDATNGQSMLGAAQWLFNSLGWSKGRTPDTFKHAIATAAGNTAVWTPAAGKKFRLMRFAVGISGGTLLAVAGIETITFQDSASGLNGVRFDVQVPSTAVTGEEYFSGWIDWGNGFLSAAANNVLNVNLGTATTAGGVTVMVAGTEE